MPTGIYIRTPEMKTGLNPNSGFKKGHKSGMLGKKHSKKTKNKIREILKTIGLKPPSMQGKHWKISERASKHLSEIRKNQPAHNKGKNWKLKFKRKGIIFTEKHKKNMSKAQRGIKNHQWRGGISFKPYATDWTETLRQSIRERDHYICQLCGKTQIEELEKIEKKLSIHHIDYNKKNCNPDNLITFCVSCNSKVNKNRDYWIDYFSN